MLTTLMMSHFVAFVAVVVVWRPRRFVDSERRFARSRPSNTTRRTRPRTSATWTTKRTLCYGGDAEFAVVVVVRLQQQRR